MHHEHPVENKGPPSKQQGQPSQVSKRKSLYPSLEVFNPLQYPFCQHHRHPIGTDLGNVDVIWVPMIEQPFSHQAFQNSILVRKTVPTLRHLTGSLDASLEEKVDQVKFTTSMVVPPFATFHMKGNGGWRQVGVRILMGGIPGSIIGGQGLMSEDTVLESTMSEVLVVLEGHDDGGGDDESFSWTMNFFYPPRSCTIPKVV